MRKAPDIERLIASAYSGLGPSAAVEEAVRAGLASERAPSARTRAAVWLLPVAAVLAVGFALTSRRGAAPGLADEGDAVPDLPAVARPPTGVVSAEEETTRVRLCRGGRILVPVGSKAPAEADGPADDRADRVVPAEGSGTEWRLVSLAELARHLEDTAQGFDRREAAAGRSGYETTAGGVKASRLRVDLFADRNVPWQHVQWILTVCAELRMPRVAFAVRGSEERAFGLDATLPTDLGLLQEPKARVGVYVRPGKPVRYAFGEEESEELASVARYLAAARKAAEQAGAPVRGELKAGAGTAFHEVSKLLAEFRQAGYEHVDFYGTAIPGDDLRRATKLPAPEQEGQGPPADTRDR